MMIVEIAVKKSYTDALERHRREVREMVLAGLGQVKEGDTRDFNEVCDRLVKKYMNAAVRN